MRVNYRYTMLAVALCAVITHSPVSAQDNVRAQLFKDADHAMSQAKDKKADIYGPSSFARAMEYYNEAADDYRRGRNLEDIRAKLRGAVSYFAKAIDACKLGEVTFSSAMAARTDAISADAPRYSAQLWTRAEQQLISAAKELEDGDVNDARKEAGEAEGLYRTAELEAIKANYLTPARELLKRADDLAVKDNAPKTLERARKLSAQAEALIKQNRYDTDEARQLAQEAKYEAAHAIYLHQTIAKMEKEDMEYEDVMLAAEAPFLKIAGALDLLARFDAGFEPPTKELLAVIDQRESKARQDAEAIARLEGEVANLKQQVTSMEGRVGSLTEAEKDLQRKLDLRRRQEETFALVSSMFDRQEGNVLRDANNIVIRLYGLTFPVGRNTIEPQYFSLLTKVQEAIKQFPGCQVAIEGHTDSQGSDQTNQTLSHARAEAVAQYLKANMVANTPITSQGFGETRPVASNDTYEGRAKNRRIDVVIIPEWAIVGR